MTAYNAAYMHGCIHLLIHAYVLHFDQDDTTPEEALGWIPSLSRFDDDEIMKAVNIVIDAKQRIGEGL
jgi:hypothetical protein